MSFTGKNTPLSPALSWILSCGARYWPGKSESVAALALPAADLAASRECILITLPDWAADIGVGTPPALLVDQASLAPGDGDKFPRCNWLCAAFMFLSGEQEEPGGDLSYTALRRGTDPRLFDHAWVNRIFLLLRRMAARKAGLSELDMFGPLPRAEFHITHDVDAVRKTLEIRVKQTAFHLFNASRAMARLQFFQAVTMLGCAARFFFTSPSYWNFATVRQAEAERGLRSTFNFYGGMAGWRRGSLRKMLMDPAYDVYEPGLRRELRLLQEGGWGIGLHPSFDAWGDTMRMQQEREAVEAALGGSVTECRQHWLRFNWARTWRTQQDAGLRLDTTLGFNDRPAFRNGGALRFNPWDTASGQALAIEALPMLLMDSHFYDYAPMTPVERRTVLARWLGEVRAVGGEASVNWHVHTLAPDYGWEAGYRDLLYALA